MTDSSSSGKIDINGYTIWYERFGSGPKPVLLIPGAIGTGRTDYWEQVEGEDALDLDAFTLIAVEPMGWGRSGPPARRYDINMYNKDADIYETLMKHLGYKHYSVIAWSDGAKSGITLAIKYSDSVNAMVLIGASICASRQAVQFLNTIIKTEDWSADRLNSYLRSYESREKIQDLWTRYVKSTEYHDQYFGNDMFGKEGYRQIKCPVIIIFGEKDQITDTEQCLHLNRHIRGSKLMRFPTAGHDFHQRFTLKFKIICEELFSKV